MSFFRKFVLSRRTLKPYVAEFLGTALLIVIGDGVVAQCLLSDYQYGTWLSINIAWAAAVCISGYLSDPSPTINPAVTICLALVRPTPGQWKKLPGKICAQVLGGFVGAALVYINYRSAIEAWDPEYTIPGGSILSPKGHHSAGIFSTYPAAHFSSNWEAAFSEWIGAAVLMFGSLSISDPHNGVRFQSQQVSVFLLMTAIGAALGWQTGYAINPARDLGPRLFSAIVYGREVFSSANYYFVVPIFAPILGCIVGATVYDSLLYEGDGSRVTDALDKAENRDGTLRLD
ncbi:putative glycerol uptake facilitator [Aspergillus steynii IBT 23096]|uniref:Putative glycerol uptake facilitator n=1 Tax=Aspergillus steynii IBT 23096 TaxID=1392250 RepID=A0A2I2G6K3_9EURO|nr:putative glycerol uptake facilitator [Aspergillus steynii IBT 23096]PLB48508.1 putative glycerol uptake facilitator [Aspergillus steynii IBT 23096]